MNKIIAKALPVLIFPFLIWNCSTKQEQPKADLVFVHGKIWRGGDSTIFSEGIAIKGNKILKVGTTDEVLTVSDKNTQVVDLEGRLMIPGFNDAHIHFLNGSIGLSEVNLTDAKSIDEVVLLIKKYAAENPGRKWITGRGWQYTMFPGGLPTKEILDSAIADRPVFIKAYDGHSAWANSSALKLAGINKSIAFSDFGEVVRFPNGELTGVFKEKAMGLIGDQIPELTSEEKRKALQNGMKMAASLGITSIGNASGSIEELNLYKDLLNNHELTLRVAAAFSVNGNTTEDEIQEYKTIADSVGANHNLTARNIKFVLDGVIESHTAAMLEPYSNLTAGEKNPTGTLSMSVERYRQLVSTFDKLGFQIYTHAIGDRAVREALNAYQQASQQNNTKQRHRIEHIETINPIDIPRFAQLGILPSMQPIHAEPGTVSVWVDGVGKKRLPNSFAWNSMLNAGGYLVFASDWPACVSVNPIRGLHTAVTRRTVEGQPKAGWLPEQTISIHQALKAYTLGGSYSSNEEEVKGKIAPGYLADLAVLSQDLFSIEPMKTHETKVMLTVFDGKIIYDLLGSKK